MSGHKQSIDIGKRAYSEVLRLFPKMKDAETVIGCNKKAIYSWNYGVAPSSLNLARLHYLGADVIWILTGRRNFDGKEHNCTWSEGAV